MFLAMAAEADGLGYNGNAGYYGYWGGLYYGHPYGHQGLYYGKRSADAVAAPEAAPTAEAANAYYGLSYGSYGWGHRSSGYGKRSAGAEAAPAAEAYSDA